MSISLVSNSQAVANTVALGVHATGDLILACCTNDNAATVPTKPSGWTLLWSAGSGTGAIIVAYKYAQSNSESFGSWTNADHVSATVWRGAANTIVWPWFINTTTGTSVNMLWAAQAAGTFRTDSEDNALFAYGHNRSATNNLAQTLGALTNLFEQGDGSTFQCAGKYQTGRTTALAGTTLSMGASVFWRTISVCMTEQTGYGFSGGGGLLLPRGFQGGL